MQLLIYVVAMKVLTSALLLLGCLSLSAQEAWVSLSKVGGFSAWKGKVALFKVQEEVSQLPLEFRGPGANSFAVSNAVKEENGLLLLEIEFKPTTERGYFSAELVVGSGDGAQVVQLRGVATAALEGKNEPPLQELLDALGANLDAGGKDLSLDSKATKIGDSVKASQFEPVGDGAVRLTPLARYSPPGDAPFGLAIPNGKEFTLQAVGSLAATTPARPDGHQTLRPPLATGAPNVTVVDAPKRFGLFLEAHKYTSLTFPGKSVGAPIKHTARIYPVEKLGGKALQNAYIVGFEEASNGDYQDAVFLIEGVKVVK